MAYTPQEEAAWAQYQAQQSQPSNPAQSSYTPQEEQAWAQYQKSQAQAVPAPNNSSGNWLWDQATSIARAVAQPAVETAEGTQNLVSRGLGYLFNKSPETFGTYHDDLLKNAANPTEAALLSIPASFLLPGGALLKGAKGLEALGTGAGLGAGYGAAMGAAQDPNSNVLKDSALGAAIPTALTGLLKGVPAAIGGTINAGKGAVAKSVLNNLDQASQRPYSSVATPQQAANKLAMIGDAPVDIGHLVNDVGLAQKYKKMSTLWGSNNPQRMEEVVGKTNQVGDELANQMWQGHDENTGTQAVLDHIKDNAAMHNAVSKDMYDQLSSQAGNRGIVTNDRPNSQEVAQQLLQDHKNTENLGGVSWLSNSPHLKLIQSIAKGVSPANVDSSGNPLKTDADYKDLKNLRTFVGSQIAAHQQSPANNRDNAAIGNLGKVYNALNSDMGAALESNPDLHKMWGDASQYYKNNVVPYNRNKAINNLVNSDSTQNIFNTLNKNDPQIQQVVSHMNPEYQKLLLGLGMRNAVKQDFANDTVSGNATKLASAYSKLNNSPILQNTLDDSDHDLFKKLSVMNDIAKPYRPLLNSPETGAKNTGMMSKLLQAGTGLSASMGAHSLGLSALPATALGLGGTAALIKGGNALTNLMANPKILEAYSNPDQRNALIREAVKSAKGLSSGQLSPLPGLQQTGQQNVKNNLLKQLPKNIASKVSDPRLINYLLNIGN